MRIVAVLVLSTLLTAACASGGGGADSGEPAAEAGTVIIDDFSFAPETTKVKVGDEVQWEVQAVRAPTP